MCRETGRQLSPQILVGELQSGRVVKGRPQGRLRRGKDGGQVADHNDTKQPTSRGPTGSRHYRLSVTVMLYDTEEPTRRTVDQLSSFPVLGSYP